MNDQDRVVAQQELQRLSQLLRDAGQLAFDVSELLGTPIMPISCVTTQPSMEILILECGSELTSNSETFNWSDPGFTASTLYDFWIGTSAGNNDVYDLNGMGTFNDSSITVPGLPTNGETLHLTLFISRDGTFTDVEEVACTVTAAVTPFQRVKDFTFQPATALGNVTDSIVQGFTPETLSFINGEEYLEVAAGQLTHELLPTSGGSTRTEFGGAIPDANRYRVCQTVLFEAPFDFGGPVNQTTKIGWGLGSANYVSGGSPVNAPDVTGFSIRPIQRNGVWKAYSYSCDRNGGAGGFGEDWNNGVVVPVTPGTAQRVCIEIGINTGTNSDGYHVMTVDGVVIDSRAVKWMEVNHNITDCRFQSFFGGGDASWSPDSPQRIRYTDVYYESAN